MLSFRLAIATASLSLVACQPAAFPRTADLSPRGEVALEVQAQPISWEPQRVTLATGRRLASDVASFPIIQVAVRASVGRCETGGFYALTRFAAETRCGLLQERRRDPFSVAISTAGGFDYGVVKAPFVRAGIDVSRWLGPIAPLAGAYLSSNDAYRYIEDAADPPLEGPFQGSKEIVRRELRLTTPIGVAIRVGQIASVDAPPQRVALVLGAMPWWLLRAGPGSSDCGSSCAAVWKASSGSGFSIGVEVR